MNKKKLLYISTIEDGPYQGVRAKISMQCKAFEENGFDVELCNSGIRTTLGQIEKLLPTGYGVNYRIIRKRVLGLKDTPIAYCYVRYSPASRGLIDVLKTLKSTQKNIKIILEIPTYPYETELKTLRDIPFKIRERLYRGKLKKYVDLIVSPSHLEEDQIFGVPAYEITNGINVDSIKPRELAPREDDTVNLLGIALITAKQGFDRVLRGMHEYYRTKTASEPNVRFYVIGDGDAKEELVALSDELSLTEHVVYTGQKEKHELEDYYSFADLGIGTLGLYKSNELSKVNSLKTREYCAKGLPFVITDCDYVFADNHFEFAYVIANDDSPLNIREILGLLNEQKRNYTDEQIAEKMSDFAKEHLSWSTILRSVIETADTVCPEK